jgi:hypothetical protein
VLSSINVVIKDENNFHSFCFDKGYLDKLVTNLSLYKKDITFIINYIEDYSLPNCDPFLPGPKGIVFIDMIHNIILDSQDISSINKVSPAEIRMSYNGNIVNETHSNSLISRVYELVEAGYLVGFEEWQHKGYRLNTDVSTLSYDELIKMVLNTSSFGQFVFDTRPYRVEEFDVYDWQEQNKLFNRAAYLEMLPMNVHEQWQEYLRGLRK